MSASAKAFQNETTSKTGVPHKIYATTEIDNNENQNQTKKTNQLFGIANQTHNPINANSIKHLHRVFLLSTRRRRIPLKKRG